MLPLSRLVATGREQASDRLYLLKGSARIPRSEQWRHMREEKEREREKKTTKDIVSQK